MTSVKIKKAMFNDLPLVVEGMDNILSKEGFGFVNKMQIKTEIKRGTVFIAYMGETPCGFRVGKDRLWNIAVYPEYRGMGIGKILLSHHRPNTIRVKNTPIGHLSKEQRENFTDPTPFYEAMGYTKIGTDFGRNFWQKGSDKANFHKQGKIKHISIYIDEDAYLFSASAMTTQEDRRPE